MTGTIMPGTRVRAHALGNVTGVVVPLEGEALQTLERLEAQLRGTRHDHPRLPGLVAIKRDGFDLKADLRYQFAQPEDLTVI